MEVKSCFSRILNKLAFIMNYPEQLKTDNWKRKRQKILQRDKNKCQNCNNEFLIKELQKGLFNGYCFPTQRNAIDIDGFGEEKLLKAGIDEKYCNFLNKHAFVYSKKIQNWKRTVLGLRKPTDLEFKILIEYNNKIDHLIIQYSQTLDPTLWNYITALNNEKITRLIELENEQSLTDLNWVFMLGLHIHHNYYIKDLKAWEYKDDALKTLCYDCHETLHKNELIPVYNNEYKLIGNFHYCLRCHGAGVFPEYNHVQNGICFRCNGMRYEELITNINTM